MITYKAILEYFSVICERHQHIKQFTYGEPNFFDEDKFNRYPAVHLTPSGTAIDDQVVTYGFDVVVYDRYNVASNKMRNEANCMSDALLILQDLCKELTKGRYFINEDTNIKLELPIVATPFIDTEPDNCSGWSTSFEVLTPNEASECIIPYFNSEIQKALTYKLPDSVSSEIAWWSREQIHRKATFVNNELTELDPVVDTTPDVTELRIQGDSVTWSYEKNAFVFLNTDSTTCRLFATPITTDDAVFFLRIKDFGRFVAGSGANSLWFCGSPTDLSSGVYVDITSTGTLRLASLNDGTQVESAFPICPTNGTDSDEQHRRLESLTIAIKYSNSEFTLYYGSIGTDKVSLTTTFEFDLELFGVGEWSDVARSDFNMQEFLYSGVTMTDTNILKTIEWLNHR